VTLTTPKVWAYIHQWGRCEWRQWEVTPAPHTSAANGKYSSTETTFHWLPHGSSWNLSAPHDLGGGGPELYDFAQRRRKKQQKCLGSSFSR